MNVISLVFRLKEIFDIETEEERSEIISHSFKRF